MPADPQAPGPPTAPAPAARADPPSGLPLPSGRLLTLTQAPALPWLLAAAFLVVAPWIWSGGFARTLLCQAGIAVIACLAYNLLFGQGGMVSFGHAVYSGLGAFLAIHALRAIDSGWLMWPVSLVPLLGGLAGLAVAALLGSFSVRRAGTTFAMISLGVAELVYALVLMLPGVFGGEGGLSANRVIGPPRLGISFGPQIEVYYLIAAYVLLCTLALYGLTLTPFGRLLNAVRDNPLRVSYSGYSPPRLRYQALLISGFFSGIAGGLTAIQFELITGEVLSAARSGSLLLFVFLGGAGFFLGPVIGALLMVLALMLLSEWTQAWMLYVGCAFLVMVVLAPQGLAGLLAQAWRLLRPPGGVARLGAPLLALVAGVSLAGAGSAVLIEMLYHRRQALSLGDELRLLGGLWDSAAPRSWAIAAGLAFAGAVFAWKAWRRLRQRLRDSDAGEPPGRTQGQASGQGGGQRDGQRDDLRDDQRDGQSPGRAEARAPSAGRPE
ncbi:MAG: branched-chain amino acid ABC transporter permease [Rubrivivax sp.]|nr:branched-chain amino acid ABC transporter permease [Rubrivivax sp.]